MSYFLWFFMIEEAIRVFCHWLPSVEGRDALLMSKKAKAKAVARGKTVRKKQTKSSRAGLVFPVSRVYKQLREGKYAERVSLGAPVYCAAVLEYLCAELLEAAGNGAHASLCCCVCFIKPPVTISANASILATYSSRFATTTSWTDCSKM